jgi:hypothetical protein
MLSLKALRINDNSCKMQSSTLCNSTPQIATPNTVEFLNFSCLLQFMTKSMTVSLSVDPYACHERVGKFIVIIRSACRPGSSVGIAIGYGVDGPMIESLCGRNFLPLSRPALGPPSLLYNGYRVFPGGKAAGA